MKYIKRSAEKVIKRQEKMFKAILVTGSRQVGKTTMLKNVKSDINYLTLEKTINSGYNSSARKCPGCGANISVNTSGKCEYCGSIFNIENYDWVLTSIEM